MKNCTDNCCADYAALPLCPRCGEAIDYDDAVYTSENGDIAGCEKCIHTEYGWQFCLYSEEGE